MSEKTASENNMTEQELVRVSKFLSKHLRHAPQKIGIELDSAGWVEVEVLLRACAKHGFAVSRAELDEVVAQNSKQRFAFSDDGLKIRANQGHSVEVDLELTPQIPPEILYHGTATHNLEAISRDGLQKMRRHHVHLSPNIETATKVGARHGKVVVLEVDARRLSEEGVEFFVSENGVWLVDSVAPNAFRVLD